MISLTAQMPRMPVIRLPGTVFEEESDLKESGFEDKTLRIAIPSIAQLNSNQTSSNLSTPDTSARFNFSLPPPLENSPRYGFLNPTPSNPPHTPHLLSASDTPSSFSLKVSSLMSSPRSSTSSPRLEHEENTESVLKDGTTERGIFLNNKLHGRGYRKQRVQVIDIKGFIQVKKGVIEQGEFENGLLTFGEKLSSTTYEEGHIDQDGKLDGAGHRIFFEGTEEVGLFEKGEFKSGVKTWADGTYEKGKFVEGLLTGEKCKRFSPNCEVMIGTFVMGVFRLEGVKYNSNHAFEAGQHSSKTELRDIVVFESYEEAEMYFDYIKKMKKEKITQPIPAAFGSIRTKVYTRQTSGEYLLSSTSNLFSTYMSPARLDNPYMKMVIQFS